MRTRTLGGANAAISEIGFGAWGIGGRTPGASSYGDADDDQSRRALRTAFELGCNFFDTSNVYGDGHSETLIGEVFADDRDDVFIATKAGLIEYDAPLDFTADGLRRSLEGSLERLAMDRVDLLQLHNPDPADPALDAAFAALEGFRAEGMIGHFGASLRAPEDGIKLIERYAVSAVQTNLNLLDQRALDSGLLDRAKEQVVGVIIRTPLCFGFLSGEIDAEMTFPPGDHRNRWPRQQIREWVRGSRLFAESVAGDGGQTPVQAALRFCLSHAGVTAVIPGIMSEAEARENCAAGDLGPLSAEEFERARALYAGDSFFVAAVSQLLIDGETRNG